jgi:O-antigen/teichoic acid export membrane protein
MPARPGASSPPDSSALVHIRHLARHSALLLSTGAFGYLGALALNVVLARALGPAGFGAWVVAWGLGLTLASLGLIGADWVLLRQGSYYEGIGDTARLRKTLQFALILSGSALAILTVGLVVAAPFLARSVFHQPSLTPLFRLAALMGPVSGVGQVLLAGTQSFKTVKDLALVRNVVQPIVRLVLVSAALVGFDSAVAALAGALVAEVLLTATAALRLHRRIPLLGPTAPVEVGRLVRFGLPAWGSRLAEVLRIQAMPLLVASLASISGAAVFAAARRVVAAPSAVIASMNQVYAPQASNLYLQDRRAELAGLFKGMGKWSFAMGFPMFCLMVAFPEQLLSVFGDEFAGHSTALVVMAVGALFQLGTGPVTTTLMVLGRSGLALFDYLLVIALQMGLAVLLIPRYGVLGGAVARAAGTVLNNVVPLAQVWFLLRIHPYRLDYWKPAAAAVAATILARVTFGTGLLGNGFAAAAGAGVILAAAFLALLVLLGLSADDRAAIDALLRRTGAVGRPARSGVPPPEGPREKRVS